MPTYHYLSWAQTLALVSLLTTGAAASPSQVEQSSAADTSRSAPGSDDADAPDADDAKNKARAAAIYQMGVKEFQQGRYSAAIAQFLRADALHPTAAFSYNIARAYDSMGDTARSLRWYRDYLRRSPEAEDRKNVLERIEQRERGLQAQGVQQVTVLSTPKGATVVIDGQAVGVTPWTGELTPGDHNITLSSNAYENASKQIYLEPHRAMDVEMTLEPAPASTPQPELTPVAKEPVQTPHKQPVRPISTPQSVDADSSSPLASWPLWVGGAGVASLVVASGFEVARRGAEDDAKNAQTQLEHATDFDRMQGHQNNARLFAAIGGGLLVAAGVGWLLNADSEEQAPTMAVGCSPTGCGFLTRGSF